MSPARQAIVAALDARRGARPLAPALEKALMADQIGYEAETFDSGLSRFEFVATLIVNQIDPGLVARLAVESDSAYIDATDTIGIMKRAMGGKLGSFETIVDVATGFSARVALSDDDAVKNAIATMRHCAAKRKGKAGTKTCAPATRMVEYWDARNYYEHHYPWDLVMRLLHRSGSPAGLREFRGEVYPKRPDRWASRPILSTQWLQQQTLRSGIVGIHVSKAYSSRDQEPRRPSDPLGIELALEIDTPPKIGSWEIHDFCAWKKAAVHAVLQVLEAMGETIHLLFYSGGKSPHLWLLSEAVRSQTKEQRSEFVARLKEPWKYHALYDAWCKAHDTSLSQFDGELPADACVTSLWPEFDDSVLNPANNHRLPLVIYASTGHLGFVCESPDDLPGDDGDVPTLSFAGTVVKRGRRILTRVLAEMDNESPPPADSHDTTIPVCARASYMNREEERCSGSEAGAAAKRGPVELATLPIASFHVDIQATRAWMAKLEDAAALADIGAITDARIRAMADHALSRGQIWQLYLARQAVALQKRLVAPLAPAAAAGGGVMVRQIAMATIGRTVVAYPELGNRKNVMLGFSGETRIVLTGDVYDELDVSGCHLNIAWSAVVRRHGLEEARRVAQTLETAATDRTRAVATIEAQMGSVAPLRGVAAKSLLYTAINKIDSKKQPCEFLRRLTGLRDEIEGALLELPVVREVREQLKTTKDTTLLSMCLQRVEGVLIAALACHLTERKVEIACYENDAVKCRMLEGCTDSYEDLLRGATERMAAEHGMRITIGVKHRAANKLVVPAPAPAPAPAPTPAQPAALERSGQLEALVERGLVRLVEVAFGGRRGCIVTTAECSRETSWTHRGLFKREGFGYSKVRSRNIRIQLDNATSLLAIVRAKAVLARLSTNPTDKYPLEIQMDVFTSDITKKLDRAGFTKSAGSTIYRGTMENVTGLKTTHLASLP